MALDFTALAIAYIIGMDFLAWGYVLGGPVRVGRHSIQLVGPGRPRRISGRAQRQAEA